MSSLPLWLEVKLSELPWLGQAGDFWEWEREIERDEDSYDLNGGEDR